MKHKLDSGWVYYPHRYTAPASGTGLAVTGKSIWYGITITTDGTNNVTLDAYDNTGASGTQLLPTMVVTGSSRITSIGEPEGLPVDTGIYISITCAGTYSYQVQYDNN